MDKTKQPGIEFKTVILVEESFWRSFDIPNNSKLNINFKTGNNIMNQKATVEITTSLKLTHEENEVLKYKSKFVGIFLVEKDSENMGLKEFIQNNAPALMFPYIREQISSITSKSGIKPIVLPPINLMALINK